MMTEVFIENERLDVSADISALMNYAIDDIKDFSTRNTTFSKTIVLPGTANNNKILGHIFDFTVSNPYDDLSSNVLSNFNASVSAECLIFQDNIQVFKGILRLMEIVIVNGVPEYEVAVFGELGGFVLKLGNKKLEELDFSIYDHVLNVSNITGSWNNVSGTGYYYPLIDIGGVSQNKVDYDFRAFRPALKVWEYIDKIFSDAGYNYSSNLFSTGRFRSLIIPYGLKRLTVSSPAYVDVYALGSQVINSPTPNKVNFPTTVSIDNFTPSDANQHTFNYDDLTPINPVITLNVSGTTTFAGPTSLVIGIYRLRGAGPEEQLISTTLPVGNFVKTLSVTAEFIQNDDVYVKVTGITPTRPGTVAIKFGHLTILPQSGEAVEISYGDTVEMNRTIPKNVLQKDFISSVIRLFNLYLYEDSRERNILIEPYVDFYDTNPANTKDWTYKQDRSKATRLKPMSELNSRYYNFKFKQDSDYYNEIYRKRYNESYGDRTFDSGFEFTNEKTDIELIFSPSVLVGYTGVDKIVTTFYKLNATVEEKNDVNIRILQAKKVLGVNSWSIKNGVATLQSGLTSYGYAGHYDDPDAPANDIHFGVPQELFFTLVTGAINVTQFNVYWSPYMAEITDKDSKMLIGYFKLTNKDIFELDFSKPIYLDGSYWRLNKIIDWNASTPDVCQVELLKIINLIY